jgi:tetratricopeptide (TPR) repeat protein
MEAEIRADAKVSAIELHRLPQVAQYYAQAKQWKKAGAIYEELKMYEEATAMYIQGGEVDHIEQISVRQEDHVQRVSSAEQYYEEAANTYRLGQRDRSYQALKQCLTVDAKHANARKLFDQLEQLLQKTDTRLIRIPVEEREYMLIAKNVMTVGRQEGNELVVNQNDVSRRHARLGFARKSLLLEDLKSSNGTRLNGLRIQQRAQIRDRDTICFGRSAQYEVHLHQSPSGISALLCPQSQQIIQKRYLFFSGDIHIGSAKECDFPLQYLPDTAPSHLFKIHYQPPFWYFHIHPQAADADLNGVPVKKYVVVVPGDTLTACGIRLIFE